MIIGPSWPANGSFLRFRCSRTEVRCAPVLEIHPSRLKLSQFSAHWSFTTPLGLSLSKAPARHWNGAVAQLGERVVRNDEVRGSIPLSSTSGCMETIRENTYAWGKARPDLSLRLFGLFATQGRSLLATRTSLLAGLFSSGNCP